MFDVTGREGLGVHSGREGCTDLAGRTGINYATLGCIRTTDEATAAIRRATRHGYAGPDHGRMMARLSSKLRSIEQNNRTGVSFWCPGCREMHAVTTSPGSPWTWDGNVLRPFDSRPATH